MNLQSINILNKKLNEALSFKLIVASILTSLSTAGLGNHIFGFELFTDFSTLVILIIPIILIFSQNLRIPIILLHIYLYVIIQTFAFNLFSISFFSSLNHFLGFIIFSLSIFSFISSFRNRLVQIMQIYFKYVFFVVCIAIFQIVVYLIFKKIFLPQELISGFVANDTHSSFAPEILGVLPRAVGLSSEPASYCIVILPGVFMSLMIIMGQSSDIGLYDKKMAYTIILGFILSFSLVGYFGLFLCIIVLSKKSRGNFGRIGILILAFAGLLFFISKTSVGSKISSIFEIQKDVAGYEYQSSDLSAFALLSNIYVAKEALQKSNYLGTGINSHKETYDETIYKHFSTSQVIVELNRQDAGALFIRLISEFGFPGIIFFIFFLYRFKIKSNSSPSIVKSINSLSLVMLISYSVRNGGYLNIVFLLFFAMYYYSFIVNKNYKLIQETF